MTVRSSDHDHVSSMARKLLSKARVMAENTSVEAVFEVRSVAAQIGWLETCLPVAAAQAVTDIELFLSSGAPKGLIHHQLEVFEAFQLGLLATWETPDVVICVPRTHPVFRLQGEWDDLRPFRAEALPHPSSTKVRVWTAPCRQEESSPRVTALSMGFSPASTRW